LNRPRARILVDATPLWATSGLRGIGRYLRDLLTGLARVRSASPDLEILAVRSLLPSGASVTADLDAVVEESRGKGGSIGATQRHLRRTLMPAVVVRHRASLLHLPEVVGTPLGLPVPLVATCHDLIPLRFPEWYLPTQESAAETGPRMRAAAYAVRWAKDQRRYRLARRVVAISSQTRDDLVGLLRIPAERIDVVHNGLALGRYEAPEGPATASPHARPYILYVGFCDPRKNVPALFAALAEAARTRDLDLLWAGDIAGRTRDKVLSLAAEHGITDRLKLLGFVTDEALGGLYRHAVGLVFLSRMEGFGLPVVEAMAAGCPVIVARGSGSDELVGDAGVHVSPDDPGEAAREIVKLLDDPSYREALRAVGPARAAQFSCEAMGVGYVGAWRRALGRPEAT